MKTLADQIRDVSHSLKGMEKAANQRRDLTAIAQRVQDLELNGPIRPIDCTCRFPEVKWPNGHGHSPKCEAFERLEGRA